MEFFCKEYFLWYPLKIPFNIRKTRYVSRNINNLVVVSTGFLVAVEIRLRGANSPDRFAYTTNLYCRIMSHNII